jgi:hypothetical protein
LLEHLDAVTTGIATLNPHRRRSGVIAVRDTLYRAAHRVWSAVQARDFDLC